MSNPNDRLGTLQAALAAGLCAMGQTGPCGCRQCRDFRMAKDVDRGHPPLTVVSGTGTVLTPCPPGEGCVALRLSGQACPTCPHKQGQAGDPFADEVKVEWRTPLVQVEGQPPFATPAFLNLEGSNVVLDQNTNAKLEVAARKVPAPRPEHVVIGPYFFRISFDQAEIDRKRVESRNAYLVANCNYLQQIISVAPDMALDQQRTALLHEIMHGVLMAAGKFDAEEQMSHEDFVEASSIGLVDCMRRNRHVAEWLLEW